MQELDCVAGTRHRAPACSTRLIDIEVSRRLATNQLDEAIDCASDEDLYTMSDELCGPALDEGIGMIWVDLFDVFEVDGFGPDGWEVFSLPIIRIRSMQ